MIRWRSALVLGLSFLSFASHVSAQPLCTAIVITASVTKSTAPLANFVREGGTGFAYVQGSSPGCTWTATTNVSWITFPDGPNGSGTQWFKYVVAPITGSSRQGTITINANQARTFNVHQDSHTAHGWGTMQSPTGWTASPSTSTVAQPFRISGYAIDDRATTGTGVDSVEIVWVDNSGSHPLGQATYGRSHPHVADTLGSAFENSGYEFEVTGIPTSGTIPAGAGVSIQAYARSGVDGTILPAGATRVTVTTPAVTVSPSTLQFGASSTNGAVSATTGAQSLSIGGFGWTSTWTATPSAPWLRLSATSGTGPMRIEASVDSALVPPSGLLSASIEFSVPAVPGGLVTIPVRLDAYSSAITMAPFGSFDPPAPLASGAVPLGGWALDDVGVSNVVIYRSRGSGESGSGPVFIGNATFVDGARPDVADAYPNSPQKTRGGWGYMLLSNVLPGAGNETWTLYAYATDVEGNQTLLGAQNVTLANNVAEEPFGAVDEPSPGSVVSGVFRISGWILSPRPGQITRTVVYLDGQPIGPARLGLPRPDVAGFFGGPSGLVDAATSGFDFTIDTRGFANGLHTIAVVGISNISGVAGVGSRYFVVSNP